MTAYRSTTEAQRLAAFDTLAVQALTRWGLDVSERRLLACRENAVYQVTCGDGLRYALRIHRHGYHTRQALHSELVWMRALADAGLCTPQVIPAPDGSALMEVSSECVAEAHLCDLLAWAEGQPLGFSEDPQRLGHHHTHEVCRQLGAMAGRIHAFTTDWPRPADFERPHWDLAGCLGPNALWGCWSDLAELGADERDTLAAAARCVQERLEAFGQAPDRYGLVHSDLVPENVLSNEGRLVVLDFDDSGHGWYLWELATAVFWYLGGPCYEGAITGYVEGYRSVRELPDEHLALMPVFLLMRSLVYMGWLHTRRGQPTAVRLGGYLRQLSLALAAQVLRGSTCWRGADLGPLPVLGALA